MTCKTTAKNRLKLEGKILYQIDRLFEITQGGQLSREQVYRLQKRLRDFHDNLSIASMWDINERGDSND